MQAQSPRALPGFWLALLIKILEKMDCYKQNYASSSSTSTASPCQERAGLTPGALGIILLHLCHGAHTGASARLVATEKTPSPNLCHQCKETVNPCAAENECPGSSSPDSTPRHTTPAAQRAILKLVGGCQPCTSLAQATCCQVHGLGLEKEEKLRHRGGEEVTEQSFSHLT